MHTFLNAGKSHGVMLRLRNFAIVEVNEMLFGKETYMKTLNEYQNSKRFRTTLQQF